MVSCESLQADIKAVIRFTNLEGLERFVLALVARKSVDQVAVHDLTQSFTRHEFEILAKLNRHSSVMGLVVLRPATRHVCKHS